MRYIKEYNGYKDIDAICKKYDIKNYTINDDGSIDVDGNVDLSCRNLNKLPLKFNRVSGDFSCYYNKLITLEGGPKEVGGDFSCYRNLLTSLNGAPKWVGGNFYCSFNQLTTLEGGPKEVGGDLYCYSNVNLPDLIKKNLDDVEYIIKWQDEYSIWKPDGSLDEYKFKEMMQDK